MMEVMNKATPRELEILKMISDHIKKYGFPPTRSEICRYFDFNSKNSATCFLNSLAKKEYIDIFVHTSRGIRITNKGKKALR